MALQSRRVQQGLALVLTLSFGGMLVPPAHAQQTLFPSRAWRDNSGQLPGMHSEKEIIRDVVTVVGVIALVGVLTRKRHKPSKAEQEVATLTAQLADPACSDVDALEERLAGHGKLALGKVNELCRSADPVVRCRAAAVLGKLTDPGASKSLTKLSKDSDASVRAAALQAIGSAETKSAAQRVVVP